jgi:hypothetical protein
MVYFWWKDKEERKENAYTMVAFVADTNYFEPSEKQFMQNFRVDDLEQLLKLSDEGVTIIGDVQSYEYGNLVGY